MALQEGEWSVHVSAAWPSTATDERLGGPQSKSGCFGEENISCLFQESNHDLSVAYPMPWCRSEITTANWKL